MQKLTEIVDAHSIHEGLQIISHLVRCKRYNRKKERKQEKSWIFQKENRKENLMVFYWSNLHRREHIPFPGPPAEKDPPPPISTYRKRIVIASNVAFHCEALSKTTTWINIEESRHYHNKTHLTEYFSLQAHEFARKTQYPNLKHSQNHSFLLLMPATRKFKSKSKMCSLLS